ncbi:MAG: hypothetical protein P1V81_16620 [Planctomycetota bacterium]|nr:hypothetical protein [Planctomycetota bacterium]
MTNQPTSSGLPVAPFCPSLRSKKFYFLEGPALTEDELLDASNDCWCKETQQRVGPDAEPVSPDDCQRGRGCFKG